jgi:hypothetical protein
MDGGRGVGRATQRGGGPRAIGSGRSTEAYTRCVPFSVDNTHRRQQDTTNGDNYSPGSCWMLQVALYRTLHTKALAWAKPSRSQAALNGFGLA